jgi:predicted alpha/beta hydrolase
VTIACPESTNPVLEVKCTEAMTAPVPETAAHGFSFAAEKPILDLVAARGDAPLRMVGHSYGGHALGLLPNHPQVQRLVTFATGAGWHGWMPPLERLRVHALWRVIGPLLVHTRGYLAWSALGLGEDLPRDVFYQWRRWCSRFGWHSGQWRCWRFL